MVGADFEASFLQLVDKLTNGTKTDINSTGTRVRLRPGVLTGGTLSLDCPTSRGVGYWLEPLLLLAPFCKTAVRMVLTGITNEDKDMSVDMLRTVVLPSLKPFGLTGIKVEVKRRGAPPKGGGIVLFECPIVRELAPVSVLEEGFVRRVRGVVFSARVSPQIGNRVVSSAR
jgi:RNA 3'-terminal phosphate cyclase-like protein